MRTRTLVVLVAVVAATILSGCGGSDSTPTASRGTRNVRVTMVDTAYIPTTLEVAKGETLTFTFINEGKAVHEAYIGDAEAQADHEKEMGDMGGMDHGDEAAVTVDPGKNGTLTHTFDTAGHYLVGCHEPGHYKAGMKLDVTVS